MKTTFYFRFANASILTMTAACLSAQVINYQGPFSGATFQNIPLAGANASWSNPPYAQFADGNSAIAVLGKDTGYKHTDYLQATNFFFSIPSTSVVKGIEVNVYKNSSNRPKTRDNIVAIVKNNITGNNNHALNAVWQAQSNPMVYGNSSDLWGETWAPADINSSGFGASLSVKGKNANQDITVGMDAILIKVYYTTADSITYFGGTSGVSLRMQQSIIKNSSFSFEVYPNPVENNLPFTVEFPSNTADKQILLVLYDVMGKEYYSKATMISSGAITEIIRPDTVLPPGMYVVTATSDDFYYRKKVMVQ